MNGITEDYDHSDLSAFDAYHRGKVDIGTTGTYVLMTETIKVEVDEALAKRFRKRAMESYGYKKGAMKKAFEEAIRRFTLPGEADWGSLRGKLRREGMGSVELQHRVWSKRR